jgi:hypothetical protein
MCYLCFSSTLFVVITGLPTFPLLCYSLDLATGWRAKKLNHAVAYGWLWL